MTYLVVDDRGRRNQDKIPAFSRRVIYYNSFIH